MTLRSEKIKIILMLILFTVMVNSCIGSCEEPPCGNNYGFPDFITFPKEDGIEKISGTRVPLIHILNKENEDVGTIEYLYKESDKENSEPDSIIVKADWLTAKKAYMGTEIELLAQPMQDEAERGLRVLLSFNDANGLITVNQIQ